MIGLAGSFLPVIPGPLTSWFGLLALQSTSVIPQDWTFLGWTLGIALFIMALDYLIPILGTKAMGGTKAGAVGSTIGLILGLFFMPFGIILGPFIGAYVGERSKNPNRKAAFKAAMGSLLGLGGRSFCRRHRAHHRCRSRPGTPGPDHRPPRYSRRPWPGFRYQQVGRR